MGSKILPAKILTTKIFTKRPIGYEKNAGHTRAHHILGNPRLGRAVYRRSPAKMATPKLYSIQRLPRMQIVGEDAYICGMILSDSRILEEIAKGTIVIDPFHRSNLGSNSYDVHLGKYLAVYSDYVLDAKKHNQITHFEIPDEGFVIQPGTLYLGVTDEYTETHAHIPFLEGKSSTGRLGIDIHATAGKGDVGFCNAWTLEISCVQPVRIYAGMPIGQLIYFPPEGEVINKYNTKENAKYTSRNVRPVESMMWKNKF